MNDYLNLKQEEKDEKTSQQENKKQDKKNKMSFGAKAGITAGVLGTAVYLTGRRMWNHFYPPQFKKYFAVVAMGAAFYGLTHCNDTARFVGKVGKGMKSEYVRLVEGHKTKAEANKKVNEKNNEIKAKDKIIKDLEKKLKQETGIKFEYKNNYEKAEQESKSNAGTIDQLANRAYELKKQLEEEQNSQGRKETNARNANNDREIKNYPSRFQDIPFSVVKLYEDFGFEKIIYVNKQSNKLSVFESKGNQLLWTRTYNCSTGKNPDPKTRKGDKATPEGITTLTYRNFSPKLSDLYGAGIYGTEWEGIVLCGADYDSRISAIQNSKNCTNGGVIMANNDLLSLDSIIRNDFRGVGLMIENPSQSLYRK